MSDPINLNRARKHKKRLSQKAAAAENVLKHGQTKADRVLQATRSQKATQMLDQHHLDDDA